MRLFFESRLNQIDVVNSLMMLTPSLLLDTLRSPIDKNDRELMSEDLIKIQEEFQLYPFFVRILKKGTIQHFIFNHGTLKLDTKTGKRNFIKEKKKYA